MKPLKIAAAVLALAAPLSASAVEVAGPIAERLQYRAYIGGLPLGTLYVDIAMDDDGYAAKARFDMIALLRVILDTDAKASVQGRWQDGAPKPERFEYWVRDRKKRRNTEMRFNDAGDPAEVVAEPPLRVKPYSMSIDQAAGAVDPATAAVMLAAPRENVCELDMKVFDGAKLHRIALAPESKSVKGDVIRCTGRYERVAGFKAKHMQDDERSYNFVAELRQVAPNRWQPIRVAAPTKFGAATAILQ